LPFNGQKTGYIATNTLYNSLVYIANWSLFYHLWKPYPAMVKRAIFHDVKITRNGWLDGKFVL